MGILDIHGEEILAILKEVSMQQKCILLERNTLKKAASQEKHAKAAQEKWDRRKHKLDMQHANWNVITPETAPFTAITNANNHDCKIWIATHRVPINMYGADHIPLANDHQSWSPPPPACCCIEVCTMRYLLIIWWSNDYQMIFIWCVVRLAFRLSRDLPDKAGSL